VPGPMPKSSYILGRTYKNQETIDWLNEYLYNPEMMPLYTSRDGNCSLTDFHLAVKGKEKLLTLFLTEDDEILGTYFHQPYNYEEDQAIKDCNAHILSLTYKSKHGNWVSSCGAGKFSSKNIVDSDIKINVIDG